MFQVSNLDAWHLKMEPEPHQEELPEQIFFVFVFGLTNVTQKRKKSLVSNTSQKNEIFFWVWDWSDIQDTLSQTHTNTSPTCARAQFALFWLLEPKRCGIFEQNAPLVFSP